MSVPCALERQQKGRLFGRPRILAGPIRSVGVGCAGRDARLYLVCARSQGQVGRAGFSASDGSLSYSGHGDNRVTILALYLPELQRTLRGPAAPPSVP